MDDITITGGEIKTILEEAFPKILKEMFESTYDNPFRDAIKEVFEEKDGEITKFVRGILSNVLTDEKFKEKIGSELVGAMIAKGLKS